jgi:hypothetical protein
LFVFQSLVRQLQILRYELFSLGLLLLDLPDQIFDHVILGLYLLLLSVVNGHGFLALVDQIMVDILDVGQLLNDLFQVCILLFELNILLDNI